MVIIMDDLESIEIMKVMFIIGDLMWSGKGRSYCLLRDSSWHPSIVFEVCSTLESGLPGITFTYIP